jgi:hypothetical protein
MVASGSSGVRIDAANHARNPGRVPAWSSLSVQRLRARPAESVQSGVQHTERAELRWRQAPTPRHLSPNTAVETEGAAQQSQRA